VASQSAAPDPPDVDEPDGEELRSVDRAFPGADGRVGRLPLSALARGPDPASAALLSGLVPVSEAPPEPGPAPGSALAPGSAPEPDPEPAPLVASEPLSAAALACEADRALVLRSFFAQPVPLKWIVGAEKALRSVPTWQAGQVAGPAAWTLWITSNRWPQASQT
jgi:hypothetical protein